LVVPKSIPIILLIMLYLFIVLKFSFLIRYDKVNDYANR